MRITVRSMQKRNSKESGYQKLFERNFRKTMLKKFSWSAANREKIMRTIGRFDVFDPVLDWDYQAVCGCEVNGYEHLNHNIRQNRLFERNGHLLYRQQLSSASKINQVTDGYEMWLLEDMSIVFTYFCCMKAKCQGKQESLIYRYALGKQLPWDVYMNIDGILRSVSEQVWYARRSPKEEYDEV